MDLSVNGYVFCFSQLDYGCRPHHPNNNIYQRYDFCVRRGMNDWTVYVEFTRKLPNRRCVQVSEATYFVFFFFQCDVGICWFTFERRSHWADLEIFPLKTLTTAVQLSWLANSQLRTLHVCCILYITSYCVATRHFILYIIHDDEACQHQIYTLSHVHRYTQISWWIDAAREWAKRIGDDAHIYSKLIPNNVCRPWRGNANEDNDCCGSGVCEKDAERA